MTTTHNTRRPRRPTKTRRGHGLRIHWGWTATALVVTIGMAKTWPTLTGAILGITMAALILYAIRPHRLAHIWHAIDQATARHRSLPHADHGYRPLHLFQQMTPARFEQAIAELALEDRDHVATATTVGGSGDGGMDVRVVLTSGAHILVQCKRYKNGNNVPARDIRDANGAYRDLHHCHAAAIVTTSDFTAQAYEHNAAFQPPLRLINGAALEAWANGGPTPW